MFQLHWYDQEFLIPMTHRHCAVVRDHRLSVLPQRIKMQNICNRLVLTCHLVTLMLT
jgi:hypothetical protein